MKFPLGWPIFSGQLLVSGSSGFYNRSWHRTIFSKAPVPMLHFGNRPGFVIFFEVFGGWSNPKIQWVIFLRIFVEIVFIEDFCCCFFFGCFCWGFLFLGQIMICPFSRFSRFYHGFFLGRVTGHGVQPWTYGLSVMEETRQVDGSWTSKNRGVYPPKWMVYFMENHIF